GSGVPAEAREQMFEPFQRLDDTSPGGLGLGLAVARGLSEAIGARLSAEDTPGGGLTMILAVPRADIDARPDVDQPTDVDVPVEAQGER
ncbi:MAG: ATP-binding protein, partial [Acidimicrobiaceae bacterium]|nr:ATP-binding protein [Acidimicrobiaceae bacterium]